MLSKQLHAHLDKMEEIEDAIKADIEKIIANLDIDECIEDPKKAMSDAVELIKHRIIEDYSPLAVKHGFDLAKLLKRLGEQGKEIKIDPSKDGTKNKDVVDVG